MTDRTRERRSRGATGQHRRRQAARLAISVSLRNTVELTCRSKHSGLRALYERGDGSRLSADLVPRLRRILLRLEGATRPGNMAVPGYHLHPLKGARRGQWSVRVSGTGAWCSDFEGTEAVDVDLIDYH